MFRFITLESPLAGPKEAWPYYSQNKEDPASFSSYFVFFAAAARAFAAFFLLLLIITMARNVPTTAEARRVRITGIRIAQTRGGKRLCRGWSSSTNGYKKNEYRSPCQSGRRTYHEQRP
jgi:hypothetical protein